MTLYQPISATIETYSFEEIDAMAWAGELKADGTPKVLDFKGVFILYLRMGQYIMYEGPDSAHYSFTKTDILVISPVDGKPYVGNKAAFEARHIKIA